MTAKTGGNLLETWRAISPPKKSGSKPSKRHGSTNCYLTKSFDESLGLILTGVDPPNRKLNLANIGIKFLDCLIDDLTSEEWENCLVLDLKPGQDANILVTVLDRMDDYDSTGRYTTNTMLKVLEEVSWLFKKEKKPPSKEEVIGAWGELVILEMALLSSPTSMETQRRISCWESHVGRTVIDFMFPHHDGGLALEVKTSVSGREHHIISTSQLRLPDDYSHGWLASIHIRDGDHISGTTCREMVDRIVDGLRGNDEQVSDMKEVLFSRMKLRGPECKDDRYRFILPDNGLRMIKMEDVPKPTLRSEITDVEWKVEVGAIDFQDSIEMFDSD